jgi:hypothetical protein
LSTTEQGRIRESLQREADRLRNICVQIEFSQPQRSPAQWQAVFDQKHGTPAVALTQAFEQRHYPVVYWARIWGFSAKTVREWLFVGCKL